MIEAHWTGLGEEAFEREAAMLGDLESLEIPTTSALVPATKAEGPQAVSALLDRIRKADPGEPLWRGVREVRPDAGGVRVEFNEPVEPELLEVGGVEVACHLHDPRFDHPGSPS
jgi:peptide/nickel transport system ATP-binding protein